MKPTYKEEGKTPNRKEPFAQKQLLDDACIPTPRRQLSDRLREILGRLICIDDTLQGIQNNLIGTPDTDNKREEPMTHYHAILLIESLVDDIETRVENLKEDLA